MALYNIIMPFTSCMAMSLFYYLSSQSPKSLLNVRLHVSRGMCHLTDDQLTNEFILTTNSVMLKSFKSLSVRKCTKYLFRLQIKY